MGTLFGAMFGYVFRGMTGSEGFNQVLESARAVASSREFDSLVQSAKLHASSIIRDVTETLSEQGGYLADALSKNASPAARSEPADWEQWPPPGTRGGRSFTDELRWPER
jgi:hypothetical protein